MLENSFMEVVGYSALDIQACMGREIPTSVPSDPKLTVKIR
jgi:hypothetical protein